MTNPNITTPKQTIAIDSYEMVYAASGEAVSKPKWDASEGWTRKQQIEAARQEALKEQAAQAEAALPHNIRLAKMEGAIADLQKRIQILESEVLKK